jgi:hypothetical protein
MTEVYKYKRAAMGFNMNERKNRAYARFQKVEFRLILG